MKSVKYRLMNNCGKEHEECAYRKVMLAIWSILVMWLECRFLDAEVDGSNPGICMLCPLARRFIRIASVDSAAK